MTGQGRVWGVSLQGVMVAPSIGQPVILLCIERALSGQLLALLSSWVGRVENYKRKRDWVTFRKRDSQGRRGERERLCGVIL